MIKMDVKTAENPEEIRKIKHDDMQRENERQKIWKMT